MVTWGLHLVNPSIVDRFVRVVKIGFDAAFPTAHDDAVRARHRWVCQDNSVSKVGDSWRYARLSHSDSP